MSYENFEKIRRKRQHQDKENISHQAERPAAHYRRPRHPSKSRDLPPPMRLEAFQT